MEWLETVTNVIVALEVAAGLVIAWLNQREVRFLEDRVKPLLADDEDLPLFDALTGRAKYVTFVAIYLLALTALGAFIGPLSDHFPPMRAINGALFLGLLAGPRVIGGALRRRAATRGAAE